MTERARERLAIPPQARSKRPVSVRFISGGQGEWSVTIMSMMPSRSACQRCSLVGAAANGWGAFEESCAVGDVFCGEVEVVGTGFDSDREAFGAGCLQVIEGEGGGEVDDVETEFVLAAEADHQADGLELGFVRA